MWQKNDVKQEIIVTETLQQLSQIYQESYLNKLRRSRDTILKSRVFTDKLQVVQTQVATEYAKSEVGDRGSEVGNRRSEVRGQGSEVGEQKEEVAVLLTSNVRFSAEINLKNFLYFYNYVTKNNVAVVVVGSSGRKLLLEHEFTRPFHYFADVADTALLPFIKTFDKVSVYHGLYTGLASQLPSRKDLKEVVKPQKRSGVAPIPGFLFEPSLSLIHEFFETELFKAFFSQTTAEAMLSSLGSGVSELERVVTNSEKSLLKLHLAEIMARRSETNRKQLNSLPSVFFWEGS